jgi:hypothetical protein
MPQPRDSANPTFYLVVADVYEPDVCTVQITQDIKGRRKKHTEIVSTGIGDIVRPLAEEFVAKLGLVPAPISDQFLQIVTMDQAPLLEGFPPGMSLDMVKITLALSLREQMRKYQTGAYKSGQN